MRRSPTRASLPAMLSFALAFSGLVAAPAAAAPGCEDQTELESLQSQVEEALGQGAACDEGAVTASADSPPSVATYTWSPNMTPLGYSERTVPTSGTGSSQYNSDLAFWGDLAFQGTYDGFRIIDVADPANPTQLVNYAGCAAGQGDVVVWNNLLVRSWDAPASGTATCGGVVVGSGFEGVHLFDISNPSSPVFLGGVRMASNTTPAGCGSHTATILPDPDRGNIYLYVGGSSGTCTGIDIVRVPIADPASAVYLRRATAGRACHDNSVILGGVNLAACAGGNGFSVLGFDPSLDPDALGGVANPTLVYSKMVTGVTIGHSATFTYDGGVLVFGHEPGGGSQAQCQSTSTTVNRSIYFFDPLTGDPLGSFVHPRPQTSNENCTWHNFNIVPSERAHVFVSGNYQSGISVVDFSNPAAATEIAYADPAPLSDTSLILGGDWSSYWYDGIIYESDIRRGLTTWSLDDARVNGARELGHSNPQTQELTFAVDPTPPTIDLVTPAEGAQYAQHSDVLAAYTCDDGDGSGIATCEGTVPDGSAIDTSTLGMHTFEVDAADNVGHTATATATYEVIDGVAPVIDLVTPADGAEYAIDSEVLADYSCDDGDGSGIATCDGTVPNGSAIDTSTLGTHSFEVDASDNAGNASTTTATYEVVRLTARARKLAVRAGLAALPPTGDEHDDERIAKALKDLDKSLEAHRWVDGDRLDPHDGKKVFDEERDTVKDLQKVTTVDVAWAIEELVEIDGLLAQTAIDDATAAIMSKLGGDPNELDKANRELLNAMDEMDKAQAEWDEGDADKAIEHFRKAWEHAQKSIEHAGKA
ncbi:MAG TPA: hypothetical protein VGB51_04785 [Actinomycetota bacterium]